MTDAAAWIAALRGSTDRFTALLEPLSGQEVTGPSYDSEWSIADVASHLGSQSEIFGHFFEAGRDGSPAPGNELFPPIWDRWNALSPTEQVSESLAGNQAFIAGIEALPDSARDSFGLNLFGRDVDLAGFISMRLSEHALHVWDIAVALDPTTTVAPDAVELLIDTIASMAGYIGKPAPGDSLLVRTSSPTRAFRLTLNPEVSMSAEDPGAAADLELPAEALLRLLAGRLDPQHTAPELADHPALPALRTVFPGF
jgi:uncharacterized protein (TIGR03083 family)